MLLMLGRLRIGFFGYYGVCENEIRILVLLKEAKRY